MATKNGYHNVGPVNKQQRGQGRVSRIPPQTNVVAAASYIRQLFERKNFSYGLMGGLEMLCLGHRREIPDVHIAYDDKDFSRIRAKLEKDHRVQLPEGMNSLLPSTILVRTGPSYHDIGCTNPVTIEVNLVPSGSYGTPPNGTLSSNLVLLGLKTNGVLKTYKALNMHYLVKTLLYFCRVRDLAWDPRIDVVFLCQHYGTEILAICGQLDHYAIQQNFLVTAFFTRLPFADQRICYQALLGQEPPPIMAVTPRALQDGHFRSQSVSELPRPQIPSQASTAPLKSQVSPDFIIPLRPGKDTPSQKRATNNGSQSETVHNTSTLLMDPAATTKDSRSRYRVVSAPSSRRNNPEVAQTFYETPPQAEEMRQMARETSSSLPSAQPSRAQQLGIDTGTRIRSNFLPITTAPELATSSMNSKAHHIAPLAPKSTKGGSLWQPSQRQYQTPAVDSSATYNPGQQHLKSQLGQAGGVIPLYARVQSVPIVKRPVPPQSRIQNSRLPLQTESRNSINSGGQIEEKSRGLQLVGPKGLYHSPQQSTQQSRSVQETGPAPPPILQSVFELDTGVNIVAELSADINAAIKTSNAGQTPVQPSWYNDPTFLDSPLNTPDAHKRASSSDSSQYCKPARPANLRTQSACINTNTLPASLTVGRIPPMREELAIPRLAPAPLAVYKAYQPLAPATLPASQPSSSISPPDTASNERPRSFKTATDAGDMLHFLQPHKRSVSHESPLTEYSADAGVLAGEYRAELPDFGRGFSFRYRS